jgi:hypothetical protein
VTNVKKEPALDPVEIAILLVLLIVVILLLPAAIWHGETDAGGWRWDTHSTIACSAWWGILFLLAVVPVSRALDRAVSRSREVSRREIEQERARLERIDQQERAERELARLKAEQALLNPPDLRRVYGPLIP